jgi:hypothetical protein
MVTLAAVNNSIPPRSELTAVYCERKPKADVSCFYNPHLYIGNAEEISATRFRSGSALQVRVRVTLRLTISQSVCLGIEPNLGQLTRVCFLLEISFRQLLVYANRCYI